MPGCGVELLIPDFNAVPERLAEVFSAGPRFSRATSSQCPDFPPVRPGFRYERSLHVLNTAHEAGLVAKCSLILGIGEERAEVSAAMADLRGGL